MSCLSELKCLFKQIWIWCCFLVGFSTLLWNLKWERYTALMTASHCVRCVCCVRILSPPTLFFPFGFDPKEQKGNSDTAGQSVLTRSQGHLVPGRIRPMACVLWKCLSYCSSALAVLILSQGGWKRMEGPYDRATVLCL